MALCARKYHVLDKVLLRVAGRSAIREVGRVLWSQPTANLLARKMTSTGRVQAPSLSGGLSGVEVHGVDLEWRSRGA